MSLRSCSRQLEVLALEARGVLPQAWPTELREHLQQCRDCAQMVELKQAFQQQRESTSALVSLPAPGAIWWRAHLRRRRAAVESMGKPILGAYLFALSTMILVAAAFLVSQAHHGLRWLDWLTSVPPPDARVPSSLIAFANPGFGLAMLIPILATLVVIGALVVYLAGERQ